MKKLVFLSIAAAAAGAVHAQEVGRVLSSTPVIQQVQVPRQVCSQQQVPVQQSTTGAGGVMGAIAGGAIGSQIGSGGGRGAATVLGVLGGALLGDRVEGGGATQYQNVQHCTTQMFYENRAVSYNVIYEYAGRQYSVTLPHDPGPTVQLQVTPVVSPPAFQQAPQAPQAPAYAPAPPQVSAPEPMVLAAAPTVIVPATSVYPAYYPSPYYWRPPVSLHLGFVHGFGHGHRHHHRHR
ncbi:glycine zipper 2TM domain-containing protein [Ramlibacter sp. Leaf400]|uniref:glycine zipper 2TM domain-containing protein n=1 Tax=Ramlibacter sp. Leaf400 TaxID=1736365 RepID=UPI0006FF151F|nr:glycine zipper 2TM domain-containing protein [Ramlibacter sp. Leaf400]KQT13569.1 hypothetical protein ASG30_19315 [Ramlibacter sp. Leaf400]